MQLYAGLQQKLKATQLVVSFNNILACIFNRETAASKFNSERAQGFWRHHNTNCNNSYSEQKTSRNTYLISGSKKSWIILKSFFNQLAKPIKQCEQLLYIFLRILKRQKSNKRTGLHRIQCEYTCNSLICKNAVSSKACIL